MVCARTVAVVLGVLASAPGVARAAATDTCDPGAAAGAQRVVTTPRPPGYQVTEVYGGGVYRVSRCDPAGRLVSGQTVAPIRDPAGRVALVPSTYASAGGEASVVYGDPRDPVWARAWAADGERVKASVLAPPPGVDVDVPATLPMPPAGGEAGAARAGAAQAGGDVRAAQANPACRSRAFVRYGPLALWTARRYNYRINGATFGGIAATRRAIVAGHRAWDNTVNDCGLGDQNNIVSGYLGLTTRRAGSRADGASVIDRGEVANITRCGGSTVAIACSWQMPDQVTGPYTETDQRYDDDYAFSNSGAPDAYDYRHIATHESGHGIGLDHATASPLLTMYPQAARGATYWRTLGLGDVLGMRNIYP